MAGGGFLARAFAETAAMLGHWAQGRSADGVPDRPQPRNRRTGRYEPRPQGNATGDGDGTPIPGMGCQLCGAPVVRSKTITAEDGSTGSMPGNGSFAVPTCGCLGLAEPELEDVQ